MTQLTGRLAVVSGASSGIGRAVAIALAEAGADLVLLGRDPARLGETKGEVESLGRRPAALTLDLTAEGAAARVAGVAAELGGAAILVHSAGIYGQAPFGNAGGEAFDRQYQANLRAPFLLTEALLPQLAARPGDIVFINSTQGLAAAPGVGQFAATQHALKALADSLRGEINARGVRVLTIHAGRTATPRQQAIFAAEGRVWTPEKLMQPGDVAAMAVAALTLPRSAEVTSLTMRPLAKL
jgi:NADP-dependent 3-hydroxy acid dehydrogenase YdfG